MIWEGCVCIIIVMCKNLSLSKYHGHIVGNYFEGIATFIRGRNIFVE